MSKIIRLYNDNVQKEIVIDVQEVSSRILFFQALFSGNFRENDDEIISLQVADVDIAIDIIRENKVIYYWNYFYRRAICEDYFGVKSDLSALDKIKIKPEEFDQLMGLTNIFGVNDHIIEAICQNFPDNYVWDSANDKLLIPIKNKLFSDCLIVYDNVSIEILDLFGTKIKEDIHLDFDGFTGLHQVHFCGNPNKIIFNDSRKTYIYDVNLRKIVSSHDSHSFFVPKIFNNFSKIIVYNCTPQSFYTCIYDIETDRIIDTIFYTFIAGAFSNDGKYFAGTCGRKSIEIYESGTFYKGKKILLALDVYSLSEIILYSNNDQMIVVGYYDSPHYIKNRESIVVINSHDGSIIMEYKSGAINGIAFSPDDKYLAIATPIGLKILAISKYREVVYHNPDIHAKNISYMDDKKLIILHNDSNISILNLDDYTLAKIDHSLKNIANMYHQQFIHPRYHTIKKSHPELF